MERRLRAMSLVGLLCVFASPAVWTGGAGGQQTGVADLREQLDRNPIGPTEELRITPLLEDQDSSALLVQVRTALPPLSSAYARDSLPPSGRRDLSPGVGT